MKIGIDIDGVILDYERVLKTYGDLYDFIEQNEYMKEVSNWGEIYRYIKEMEVK